MERRGLLKVGLAGLAGAGAVAVSGRPALAEGDFGHGLHTPGRLAAKYAKAAKAAEPAPLWQHAYAGHFGLSQVEIVDQHVIGDISLPPDGSQSHVDSYRSADGTRAWRQPLTRGTSAWAAGSNEIFVLDQDAVTLSAHDPATYGVLWKVAVHPDTRNLWSGGGRLVALRVDDGYTLVGYDPQVGGEMWATTLPTGDVGTPAISHAAVFVGYTGGAAQAYDVVTGQLLWTHGEPTGGGDVQIEPVLYGAGQVRHLVDGSGEQLVLDAETGDPVSQPWRTYDWNGERWLGYRVDEEAVVATDMSTGKERWRVDLADAVQVLSAAYDRVLVTTKDKQLQLLDGQTGELRWQVSMPADLQIEPYIAIGTELVAVGWSNERLVAYPR